MLETKDNQDFLFGVATSSTQIEGGWNQDGKGPSIWDMYSQMGLIQGKHTCFECGDSYNRLEEDLELIRNLGVNSYRFSINWTRIQPKGRGPVNQKGIDYYNRLIDGLLAMGVKPNITLFHWDMPVPLHDEGGFLNRDIVERFREYGKIVAENFGDRVEMFNVFNEAMAIIDFLYVRPVGKYVEPRCDQEVFQAIHNLMLCNAAATESLRKYSKKQVQVGMVNCSFTCYPETDTQADIDAARKATFRLGEGILDSITTFWQPLICGAYDQRMIEKFRLDTSFIQPGDMEMIQCKPDFMGCNVYTASCVRSDGKGGWEYVSPSVNTPWGGLGNQFLQAACCMYYGISFIYEKYNLPIYITENGIDLLEWKTLDGKVVDTMRGDYLERYLSWLMKAKEAGVDIRGYYAWSLMDNFEWSSGFSRRFGLVYVDFDTKERTPKSSYYHYKGLIERYKTQQ